MERISHSQLFALTVLYNLGTTVIYGFAAGAGRDAWLALLLATVIGTGLSSLYVLLARLCPGRTLVEWFPAQLGPWIGIPIAWLYPIWFLYHAARVFAEFQLIIPALLLPRTPGLVVSAVYFALAAYALYHGIEAFARLCEFLLPVLMVLFLVEAILLGVSGHLRAAELLPVAGEGWGRIRETVWPFGMLQIFGETLHLAVIFPLCRQPDQILKPLVGANILAGVILAGGDMLAMAALGEDLFKASLFPLYELSRFVDVGEFFTNLEALSMIAFSVTALAKLYVHLYAAVRSIQVLTRLHGSRPLVMPAVLMAGGMGVTMSPSISHHIAVGLKAKAPYFWIPLYLVLPITLLIVAWGRSILARGGGRTPTV